MAVVIDLARGRDSAAARLRAMRDARARGVTLEDADVLIAGVAVSTGSRLATANVNDFPMSGLRLEHWPSR